VNIDFSQYLIVLGLDPNQQHTAEEVKKKYRELCFIHHPDKGGDPEMFKKINMAYEMITNPSYRDKFLRNEIPLDMRIQVPISFEQAFFGHVVTITYNKIEFEESQPTIKIKKHQELETTVFNYPSGVMSNYTHKIIGGGISYKSNVGDAYFDILVRQHPKFRVESNNVVTKEHVDLEVLIKGGIIQVQTMYGIKEVKIRPGTSPGSLLKIPNCGVNSSHYHVIVVVPLFPSEADLKNKTKFKGLDINWDEWEDPKQEPLTITYFISG
jgi:DnaJ-class molecular chaperone